MDPASVSALITKSEAAAEQTECQRQMRSGSDCGTCQYGSGCASGRGSGSGLRMHRCIDVTAAHASGLPPPHGNCVSVIAIRLRAPRALFAMSNIVIYPKSTTWGPREAVPDYESESRLCILQLSFVWSQNFAHWQEDEQEASPYAEPDAVRSIKTFSAQCCGNSVLLIFLSCTDVQAPSPQIGLFA